MSLVLDGEVVVELSFGHATPRQALAGLSNGATSVEDAAESYPLVRRLQRFAKGIEDDFLDVRIDRSELTPFQSRVVEICRQIPFGSSLTYGEVAARAGRPRAARAVGNCMRTIRVPLIVPCHRVVGAGRAIRDDSAGEVIRRKLRLLEKQSAATA